MPREIAVSSEPPVRTPPPKKIETEANQKKSQAILGQNPSGDKYLKDCVICRGEVSVKVTQIAAQNQNPKNENIQHKPETFQMRTSTETPKESIPLNNKQTAQVATENLKTPERTKVVEYKNTISTTNDRPPQKIKIENENKKLVFSEKTQTESQRAHSLTSNKVNEPKTISPVSITATQNPVPESKTASQSMATTFQTVSAVNIPQATSTAAAVLINPAPQISVIPQIVPTLNTVLLTQLIPQRPLNNINEVRSFGDFLPVKNIKQNRVESEKFQFSTPLISTKVLAQILANKDTTSINALRAILHLFGREIEEEKDNTDLEGSYGIWKEYLRKIKRKKSKTGARKKAQPFDLEKEELGIKS